MIIEIDLALLLELGLSANEYVYLHTVFHGKKGCNSCPVEESKLQEKGYIRLLEEGVVLRQKARDLFENNDDTLFYKWINTFPIKTPKKRYLSPDPSKESKKLEQLRKKWNSIFKRNSLRKLNAIAVLEAEVAHRKKEGTMEYIHNAETWLNQGDYENYQYLLEEEKEEKTKTSPGSEFSDDFTKLI